jgi:DNA-binding GntR family transcriptional regulator
MPPTLELDAPILRSSLGEIVYQRILDALAAGQFQGGEELNEAALAARFRVSRTPVREALRRLAAEGLVVNQRNRQATIVELSRDDVVEAYEVRQILEAAAARSAARRMSDQQVAVLQSLATEAPPLPGQAWGEQERRFDEALHRMVADACGNERLRQEILRYNRLIRLVRLRVGHNPERLAQGHDEHVRIISAIAARDAQRAETEMSVHIHSALQFVLEDLALNESAQE